MNSATLLCKKLELIIRISQKKWIISKRSCDVCFGGWSKISCGLLITCHGTALPDASLPISPDMVGMLSGVGFCSKSTNTPKLCCKFTSVDSIWSRRLRDCPVESSTIFDRFFVICFSTFTHTGTDGMPDNPKSLAMSQARDHCAECDDGCGRRWLCLQNKGGWILIEDVRDQLQMSRYSF